MAAQRERFAADDWHGDSLRVTDEGGSGSASATSAGRSGTASARGKAAPAEDGTAEARTLAGASDKLARLNLADGDSAAN